MIIATLGGALALASAALAGPPAAPETSALGSADKNSDMDLSRVTAQAFVQKTAIRDLFEIQASNLAIDKTNNADVKNFARDMVQDHGRSAAALKSVLETTGAATDMPAKLDAEHGQELDTLRGLAGAAFDHEFITAQIRGHEDALKLLRTYGRNGDNGALKQFAVQEVAMVEQHLAHAKRIAVEVMQSASAQ
jgi:putative membrane protein